MHAFSTWVYIAHAQADADNFDHTMNDTLTDTVTDTMIDTTGRNACLYAIRLLPPESGAACARIAGRVEHVLTGRRHDFADGAALLAWLVSEEQRLQQQLF